MAARSPRRSFATPLVVTLAAAPACYVQSTPTQPPTQPAQPPPAQPGDRPPPPTVMNPPRPTDPQAQPQTPPTQPPAAPSISRWTVYKAKDGSCMAAIKVECQPQATCNPPPPFKYECPTNISVDPSITVASTDGGKTCLVDWGPMKCPPGAICNPPPPRQVTCPKR